MSQQCNCAIAVIGIDIGKNSFHVVGHDLRGAIVLRQKWSRGQVEARLANQPSCLTRDSHTARVGGHELKEPLRDGNRRPTNPSADAVDFFSKPRCLLASR